MAIFKIALIAVLAVAVTARPGDKDEKTSEPYEFEYEVAAAATPHSGGSSHQGHAEARVGDHSVGRYFVQLPEQGAQTRVSYTTDLWGFHPVVSYGTKDSSTRFAFGDRAIAALKANPHGPATINEPSTGSIAGNLPVSIDSAAKVAHADVSETLHNIAAAGSPPIPDQLAHDLENAKFHLNAAQSVPANPNKGGPVHAPVAPVHAAPVYAATPVPVVHKAPVASIAPFLHAAPTHVVKPVNAYLPAAQPTHVVHTAPVQQYVQQYARPYYAQPALAIHEQQKLVAPAVVAEFNSNNHLLANHQYPVSVTPAPYTVSSTPLPQVSYASPTPAPLLVPSPQPIVHSQGGLFTASTLAPTAFSVTPRPQLHHFVSSTPRPIIVADVGHQYHHVPQKEIVHVDRPYPVEVTKYVEKPVHVPVEVTKYVDRPVEVTKIVEKAVHVPVEVTKYVDRPVEVTKIVEKAVHVPVEVTKYVDRPVTKYVDRPVEVTKFVDRPVEVTKFVDRPVQVTKYVDRPVQVTKYVDRPYEVTKYVDRPVQVIKHVPVEKTVVVPGPTVEKHIPVPVTKYVDRPVPHPVAVPHPVPHPVPYAQYVLNVPYQYGGAYGYGAGYSAKFKDAFKGESYSDAAYKLDAWRANNKNVNLYSGAGYSGAGYYGGLHTEALLKSGYEGASLRTEGADLRGFKVTKTLFPSADYLPPQGPTKVTLTLEPHVHKTEKGRTLCELQGSFKPPFVPSRLLSTSLDDGTW